VGKVKRSARPSCQASRALRVAAASAGAGIVATIVANRSLSQPCRIGLVQLLTGRSSSAAAAGGRGGQARPGALDGQVALELS
jgi:hypothetical protein